MARNIDTNARRLGAKVIAQVPDVGGGAFGAARLARIIDQLRSRLVPCCFASPSSEYRSSSPAYSQPSLVLDRAAVAQCRR
jgi:hypothetical protein